MIALFISFVCDHCDQPNYSKMHRGYIIARGDTLEPEVGRFVFPTRCDAERWWAARGSGAAAIREVLSAEPFQWRTGRGATTNVQFADRLFEIFPDHRFKKAPNRAFLAPPM